MTTATTSQTAEGERLKRAAFALLAAHRGCLIRRARRALLADRGWTNEGCRPDSPWLKVARDSLRDYQAALRLLLKHSESPVADPLGLPD